MDEVLSEKPWSTGRILSQTQRERKRIMNRVSQSKRRDRLKKSVKSMENRLDDDTTMRDFLSGALRSVFSYNPLQVCTNDQFNQDALIRGVIYGWGVLQKEYFTCPIWSILSRIDILLTKNAAIETRLAVLRGIHLILLSWTFPDHPPPVAPWFRPRKFQVSSPDNLIFDYFAWPHFRERLIASNYPKLTNRFWFYFSRNMRFEWPFPPNHTIDIDKDSGKYHFTMTWRAATDSIQRFTMGPEFFQAYPDCYEDIQASYSLYDIVI
ncbi:hypothetical protein BGW36DRAFT_396584 [Talaromyces proteolyticus]|uniref:BZIP domain-containing protein n=1 Tax=Talaromyces proteolyticus TaxID=1131652 RepID=A0AAD4KYP4_9EURO|nr:uncharacterized protein BGW36DRAFT_396584 [Talaromyces proteolyticus]KAH8698961.1 hypothetical protein BGW36DRAFT_396584 [Talaromyces proteolyticus]